MLNQFPNTKLITFTVLFEENTCISSFCMYLDVYPKGEGKGVKYTFECIHTKYINIHESWALPWCHTGYISRYIQNTSEYMYLGFFITIHQGCTPRDTKSRYMHLGRVMMTLQDTIRTHHDTCILDASSEPRWIHTRYARGTLQIHLGYVSWTRSILSSMYPQHVSCMYLDYLRRYMYPACILHVFRMSPSYQIHLSG